MSKTRPSPLLPIHSLLDQLKDLQTLLEQKDEKIPLIEAYNQFIRESNRGRECTYAVKCQLLFQKQLYKKVKEHIKKIQETIHIIESS